MHNDTHDRQTRIDAALKAHHARATAHVAAGMANLRLRGMSEREVSAWKRNYWHRVENQARNLIVSILRERHASEPHLKRAVTPVVERNAIDAGICTSRQRTQLRIDVCADFKMRLAAEAKKRGLGMAALARLAMTEWLERSA
jgi:hypothetical protein